MKFENTDVWGFKHAIRGMRNPLESWGKSDSFDCDENDIDGNFCFKCPIEKTCLDYQEKIIIGENDLDLMQKLIRAGSEHRKFMRQIFVSVDITAPLYWWKEFDTYKVGTVANSTSTMHKLASTPITIDCFEGNSNELKGNFIVIDDKKIEIPVFFEFILVNVLETLRQKYNETKDKRYWKELIRLLPSSWLQTRTITINYENILTMVNQRKNHKLTEWSVDFIDWAKTLPYSEELLFI